MTWCVCWKQTRPPRFLSKLRPDSLCIRLETHLGNKGLVRERAKEETTEESPGLPEPLLFLSAGG